MIPYTSIIEQTAQKFREILGADCVLEHHSGVLYDVDQEAGPESIRLARATETWDMPVIVTTAVQFLNRFTPAAPPSAERFTTSRKASLSLMKRRCCLSTPCAPASGPLPSWSSITGSPRFCAPRPSLRCPPIFREFAPELPVTELCPPEQFQWDVFQRVTFRQAGKLTYEELAAQLQKQEQVLCIVNSRKSAQEIFLRLEGEGCFHLSTLMYPAHRRAKLEEIRRRLDKGLPCRVVSTS